MQKRSDKKAQIWVETVTYTLIGLTIIGLLIAGIKPKIEEARDESLINQIKKSMEEINQKINEVRASPGSQRKIILHIEKGKLTINPKEDTIIWEINSNYKYSEPDFTIQEGNLNITTITNNPWTIAITLPINTNITYDQTELPREFRETSTSYEIIIKKQNNGIDFKSIN
jgi:hypothetical protein